jgi:hypothetical protein
LRRARRIATGLVFWLLATLPPGTTRADGFGASLEPGYLTGQTDTTDPLQRVTHLYTQGLTQNYQLLWDRDILSQLKLSLGGTFQGFTGWTSTEITPTQRTDDWTSSVFTRLAAGPQDLRGQFEYQWRERAAPFAPLLSSDILALSFLWRPMALPELTLQLQRNHDFEPDNRDLQDETSYSGILGIRYTAEGLDARYLLTGTQRSDSARHVETKSLDQTLIGTYTGNFLDDRLSLYASGMFQTRFLRSEANGPGATVEQLQFPIAGLSLIVVFPVVPTEATLVPNPALIDGDLIVSAGLDVGYGPQLAGDQNPREMGGQFVNVTSTVNTFYVWVDRILPPEVVASYTWTAYQSDDNIHWTPIDVTGIPVFNVNRPRFEISIPPVRARYLKVGTLPLRPGVTSDPRYANVFVTEIQFVNVLSASEGPLQQFSTLANVNATSRLMILRGDVSLSWDFSLQGTYVTQPNLFSFAIINGLSYRQRLSRTLTLDARFAHRDEDLGSGYTGEEDWSASLTWRAFPALLSSLILSGQYTHFDGMLSNSVSFYNRGEIWEGVSFQLNLSANAATAPTGQTDVSSRANALISVTPNRMVTFSVGWAGNAGTTFGGNGEAIPGQNQRLDASVLFTPAPAITASASVARYYAGPRQTTLASFQLTYSPFQGDLMLSVGFQQTFDTAADQVTQVVSPTLRWTIRPGLQLRAGYTWLNTDAPVQTTRSRLFTVSLAFYL